MKYAIEIDSHRLVEASDHISRYLLYICPICKKNVHFVSSVDKYNYQRTPHFAHNKGEGSIECDNYCPSNQKKTIQHIGNNSRTSPVLKRIKPKYRHHLEIEISEFNWSILAVIHLTKFTGTIRITGGYQGAVKESVEEKSQIKRIPLAPDTKYPIEIDEKFQVILTGLSDNQMNIFSFKNKRFVQSNKPLYWGEKYYVVWNEQLEIDIPKIILGKEFLSLNKWKCTEIIFPDPKKSIMSSLEQWVSENLNKMMDRLSDQDSVSLIFPPENCFNDNHSLLIGIFRDDSKEPVQGKISFIKNGQTIDSPTIEHASPVYIDTKMPGQSLESMIFKNTKYIFHQADLLNKKLSYPSVYIITDKVRIEANDWKATIEDIDSHNIKEIFLPAKMSVHVITDKKTFSPYHFSIKPQKIENLDNFKARILEKIAKQNNNDKDFQHMLIDYMFYFWLKTNSSIDKILEEYDNSDDFQDNDQYLPPNTFLDIRCFSYLRKAEREKKINIEDIKLLYEFGYFLKDPLIDIIIDDNVKLDFKKIKIQNQFIISFMKHYLKNETQKDVDLILDELLPEQRKRTDLIESMQKELDKRSMNCVLEKNISPVNEKIKSIEKMIENLNASSDDVDIRLGPISEKMQSIEQMIDNLNKTIMEKELDTKPEIAEKKITSKIHLTQIQATENIKVVDSYKNLHQLMVNNFKSIGLINKKAKKLSSEILAGFGAGSLITFSGSLSFFIAEICARSIAAKNDIQILHIPVGLLDGYQFHNEITRCLNKSSQSDCLTAIIVEGINLSAFECYAQALSQMIINRLINYQESHNHVVCFATLAEGPAALPLSKEYCIFGPVFNTDLLAKGITENIQGGTMLIENWNLWLKSCSKPENSEPLQSLLDDMSDISQLWKISIRKVCQFLNSKNPLESIGFGWLMPLAMGDLINQELLLEFCEENIREYDDRVVKLIKHMKKY